MAVGFSYIIFIILLAATGASLLAEKLWIFDLFSHFVPIYFMLALATFAIFFATGRKLPAFICFILAVVHGYTMMPLFVVDRPEYKGEQEGLLKEASIVPITILQYNVNHKNQDIVDTVEWILRRREDFDVIMLFEVTDSWQKVLQRLGKEYPYNYSQPMRGHRGVAIFSRLTRSSFERRIVEGADNYYVVMRAMAKGGKRLVLYGVHPPPPLSRESASVRNDVLMEAANELDKETFEYKILVGDFNLTRYSPWFKKVKEVSGLHDSFDGFGLKRTWPAWLPSPLGLTIDNLLVSYRVNVTDKWIGPAHGSDHLPVVTTVTVK